MPPIIAFFDMDYTTLDTSSGLLYVEYLYQRGRIGRRVMLRIAWWTLLYKVSVVDVNSAVPKLLSYAEHQNAARLMEESYAWFELMLKDHITPRAVDQIESHRRQDQRVVLISASTQFAVQPVAQYLDVDFL